jgi:hypothetical protein
MEGMEQTGLGRPGEFKSFVVKNSAVMEKFLEPIKNPRSWVNDHKIRRLFLQASAQQWYAPEKIAFDQKLDLNDEERRIWIRLNRIFYTLEKMGLDVLS